MKKLSNVLRYAQQDTMAITKFVTPIALMNLRLFSLTIRPISAYKVAPMEHLQTTRLSGALKFAPSRTPHLEILRIGFVLTNAQPGITQTPLQECVWKHALRSLPFLANYPTKFALASAPSACTRTTPRAYANQLALMARMPTIRR